MRCLIRLAILICLCPIDLRNRAMGDEHSTDEPHADYALVKKLFMHRCVACHGGLKQQSGLRLDTGELILRGGDDGVIVLPGNSRGSKLLARISGDEAGERMPPEGSPLSNEEIESVSAWIDSGANSPIEKPPSSPRDHWSFQKPVRPDAPNINVAQLDPTHTDSSFVVRNPIDAFAAQVYLEKGLVPANESDSRINLRRVYLDLIGVPPTPTQMKQYLEDSRSDAYERVVDELLSSPMYAQRWARHWMDIWRYSDWDGFKEEVRESQPHMWRMRDWLVNSLHQDKPYDQMVIEMLAADELRPDDHSILPATGFLARNYNKFNRNTWLDSTVEHTGKAIFGLTMNCCRCHDHKYDPIDQTEYYRFRAIFEPIGVREEWMESSGNLEKATRVFDQTPNARTHLFVRGDDKQPMLEQPLEPGIPSVLGLPVLSHEPIELPAVAVRPSLDSAFRKKMLQDIHVEINEKSSLVKAAQEKQNNLELNVAIAVLGEVEARLQSVQAHFAADESTVEANADASANQLSRQAIELEGIAIVAQAEVEVAKALLSGVQEEQDKAYVKRKDAIATRDDPSRTFVPIGPVYASQSTGRRLAFARAAVSTANPLTARVAVNHMWNRHFGSALVSTPFDFGNNGKPPTHPKLLDWLATELMQGGWSTKSLHRLMVTSSLYRLSSSSLTNQANLSNLNIDRDNRFLWRANVKRLEAEAIRDSVLYVTGKLDSQLDGPDLDPSESTTSHRRSLYFRHSREKRVLFVDTFDGASVAECYRRNETIIPQQALAMMNSRFMHDSAQDLAVSMEQETDADFVSQAFQRILARPPSSLETIQASQFLKEQALRFDVDSNSQQLARQSFIRVLFNHNDFVTVR
jgi:hypothetical protein